MKHFAARANSKTVPVVCLREKGTKKWLSAQPAATRNWLKTTGFQTEPGAISLVPGRDGKLSRVIFVMNDSSSPWDFAALRMQLPPGRYTLEELPSELHHTGALGWGLAGYRFDRYSDQKPNKAVLTWPSACSRAQVESEIEAIGLVRDLINTPAEDLGPAELAQCGVDLFKAHNGKSKVIRGKALLDQGFPAVHAVGRAADRQPVLFDGTWGRKDAPKVSLVGKGVVFDSGGLDLKSAAGMKLMKKDMGGAAAILGLASLIMRAKLDVRLRVLIPAVENAVSGNSFRPLDVLQTRKGLTVEVGNTDAEGRLILCDALAEADSEKPDLLIDMATLTGAARIALGTELPALFCSDDKWAEELLNTGLQNHDPLWRMPLFSPYRRHLESRVADLNNIANVSQGGAITAALFLAEFVEPKTNWTHIDTMGWNLQGRPGRPSGGEAFAIRAIFHALSQRFPKT